MDIRQWDPSPATGYRRRPKLHPAGVAERRVKPGLTRSPTVAVLGARVAPSGGCGPTGGFAPPVTAPTASRAPSHATSAAS